ncbi:hypothetical protein [Actinokineospora globicatena]|uniref:hypothetical protein n=1 Tax=Actinokineospora globicatena TaxID=103729 RepID=UPI0020A3D145|nr:hypothetical protein [Actinokineospora globicatena]
MRDNTLLIQWADLTDPAEIPWWVGAQVRHKRRPVTLVWAPVGRLLEREFAARFDVVRWLAAGEDVDDAIVAFFPDRPGLRRRAGIDDRVVHQVLVVPEELRAETDLAVVVAELRRLVGSCLELMGERTGAGSPFAPEFRRAVVAEPEPSADRLAVVAPERGLFLHPSLRHRPYATRHFDGFAFHGIIAGWNQYGSRDGVTQCVGAGFWPRVDDFSPVSLPVTLSELAADTRSSVVAVSREGTADAAAMIESLADDIPLVPRLRGFDSPAGWASATITWPIDRPRG